MILFQFFYILFDIMLDISKYLICMCLFFDNVFFFIDFEWNRLINIEKLKRKIFFKWRSLENVGFYFFLCFGCVEFVELVRFFYYQVYQKGYFGISVFLEKLGWGIVSRVFFEGNIYVFNQGIRRLFDLRLNLIFLVKRGSQRLIFKKVEGLILIFEGYIKLYMEK